jgi:hypothetical protein
MTHIKLYVHNTEDHVRSQLDLRGLRKKCKTENLYFFYYYDLPHKLLPANRGEASPMPKPATAEEKKHDAPITRAIVKAPTLSPLLSGRCTMMKGLV